ncbi:hypothetical protein EYZ11_000213 [Aspergillus tanneri]|uniref:Uncharacterized protein n=1 Tax=Aspergillus tanneri TaxID=1220188 RepID=A0A4S3JXP7_9EURO|nr:hypothetical protein EYZ11_000213 [Aspergillus tanneri]
MQTAANGGPEMQDGGNTTSTPRCGSPTSETPKPTVGLLSKEPATDTVPANCGQQIREIDQSGAVEATNPTSEFSRPVSDISRQTPCSIDSTPADAPVTAIAAGHSRPSECDESHGSALSTASIVQQEGSCRDPAWWKIWLGSGHNPQEGISPESCPPSRVNGPWGSWGEILTCDRASRHVLYIHEVQTSANNVPSPQLVATKYSFLADHPALETEEPIARDRELLLHFQDASQMAEKEDAEVINFVSDVVAIDAVELPGRVAYISEAPDTNTGFFARCGIRDGSRMKSLFVTPLRPSLCAASSQLPPPRFPHCLLLRFLTSPRKIRGSLWDFQTQDTESGRYWLPGGLELSPIVEGSAASVIADLDGQRSTLPDWEEGRAPRIAIISGSSSSTSQQWLDPLDPLRYCDLVAKSPTLSPDFIVLALPHIILHARFRRSIANTMWNLLRQGYSVSLKPLSLRNSDKEKEQSVLLLAAPSVTNPLWVDDTFSDLNATFVMGDSQSDSSTSPTTSTEICWSGPPSAGEVKFEIPEAGLSTSSQGELPATASDGEANDSKESLGGLLYPPSRNAAHLIAAVISRIIGELSKENHPTTSNLQVLNNGVSKGIKRMRV